MDGAVSGGATRPLIATRNAGCEATGLRCCLPGAQLPRNCGHDVAPQTGASPPLVAASRSLKRPDGTSDGVGGPHAPSPDVHCENFQDFPAKNPGDRP